MLKKLMAKLGVGAATVDLRLDRPAYRLGETITGAIRIEGGSVEQRISELSVLLMMRVNVRGQEVTRPVHTYPVSRSFTVQPKPFVQEIPFAFELPAGLAVSTPSVQYYLHTKLDVERALDPTDLDPVQVLPPEPVERVLNALARLDLRQKPDSGKLTPYGQEFSFFTGRPLDIPLKELEVVFLSTPGELRLLTELDLAVPGRFGGEMERKAEIVVPQDLLAADREEELSRFLLDTLRTYAENPQAIPYVSMASYGQPPHGHQGHYGHHGHGMAGMIGGMAAGFLGGMLLGEVMEEIGESAGDMFEEAGLDFDFDGFDEL